MAYLTFADFRSATYNEVCAGLTLTTTEVADALLTSGIARLSQRLDDFTNDHFESESVTLALQGDGTCDLALPKRCTAVSSVAIINETGGSTSQAAGLYRLHSSLYSSGSKRLDGDSLDYLELLWGAGGLTGLPASHWDPYTWPAEAGSVSVNGTFGWTTTPSDIKRALALMVYFHFKPIRADLRMAEAMGTSDVSVRFGMTYPTGIPEADDIILNYKRESLMGVG